jgi:Fe-S-cluster containining protein
MTYRSIELHQSDDLTQRWKEHLKEVLAKIRSPENFYKAVKVIESSLIWQKLYTDWDKLTSQKRLYRWKAFLEEIVKVSYQTRPFCIQCGDCCAKGSPTLHKQDLQLIEKGILKVSHLMTLRKAEMAYSPIEGKLISLTEEMIKIKEKPDSRVCIFLTQSNKCTIYRNRPQQCIALECWNPGKLEGVYKKRKVLRRKDILYENDMLIEIIEAHEQRCSYENLKAAFKNFEAHKNESQVFELLAYDTECRPFFVEHLGLMPDEMSFYFGRPLIQTIQHMFGYRVKVENDNSYVLELSYQQ